MTENIFTFLNQLGHRVNAGLCHTAPGAWLLSFTEHSVTGDETRNLFINRLNNLPINLLVDYPREQDLLAKTGFVTLADIAKQIEGQSLNSFRKRLGKIFTFFLCDLYGIDHRVQQASLFSKPRTIYQPKEWFEQEIQFEYPVAIVDSLKFAIESLLQDLCSYLRKRQHQAQAIQWTITDIYKNKELIVVRSGAPQNHWQLFYDLSVIQFTNKSLPFEVNIIKLTCTYSETIVHKNHVLDFDLSRQKKTSGQDFETTIAKLKARLGDAAIYKMSYQDSRVPELTNMTIDLSEACCKNLPAVHIRGLRPAYLFTQPELIEQRKNRLYWQGYLSLLAGPERVIGEWWNDSVARDYYLAKRHDHLHIWVFYNLYEKNWYIHGVF